MCNCQPLSILGVQTCVHCSATKHSSSLHRYEISIQPLITVQWSSILFPQQCSSTPAQAHTSIKILQRSWKKCWLRCANSTEWDDESLRVIFLLEYYNKISSSTIINQDLFNSNTFRALLTSISYFIRLIIIWKEASRCAYKRNVTLNSVRQHNHFIIQGIYIGYMFRP